MKRRAFLLKSSSLGLVSLGAGAAGLAQGQNQGTATPVTTPTPAPAMLPLGSPVVPEGTFTAGSDDGPIFAGRPIVSGPGHDAITVLQPIQRHATGYLEYAVNEGPWQRVDTAAAGLLPVEGHVLKFRLPPLPPGAEIRYRVCAHTIGWVRVRQFYHGEVRRGKPQVGETGRFRALDPAAETTSFVVWNDTHENAAMLAALHAKTAALRPDFLLWNGDQSNDVHFEKNMPAQYLAPAGLAIAERWPLAYVRGNHDVRGPAAPLVPKFTGTPGDQFHYAFRSGPVAALVMDTGEDKPDDSVYFGGMVDFAAMQRAQLSWLKGVTRESWFRQAPFKVLFCHIPLYYTRDIFPEQRRWEAHDYCRSLWVPELAEAGVKLIVSGHTHSPRWMPAKEGQPIAQLIGGGPSVTSGTLLHGTATQKTLAVKMTRLDGVEVANFSLHA